MLRTGEPITISREVSRPLLYLSFLIVLLAALLLLTMRRPASADLTQPQIARKQLAGALEASPADLEIYRQVSELALDLPDPSRVKLWRSSQDLTRVLAPHWPTVQTGFVRGAFLHWPELDPADRERVLDEAGRMLETPDLFAQYWQTIWMATHDIELFRQHAPEDADTRTTLLQLALRSGQFDQYRSIQKELAPRRREDLTRADSAEKVLDHLVHTGQIPILRPMMKEDLLFLSERRPSGKGVDEQRIRAFVTYALDTGLGPLDGLSEISFDQNIIDPPLRARLALELGHLSQADRLERFGAAEGSKGWSRYRAERALYEIGRGNLLDAEAVLSRTAPEDASDPWIRFARFQAAREEGQLEQALSIRQSLLSELGPGSASRRWSRLCDRELCRGVSTLELFAAEPVQIAIPLHVLETDQIQPWVEISLDGRLVGQGPVENTRTARVTIRRPGIHKIEVKLLNPVGRMWNVRRRVAIAPSSSPPMAAEPPPVSEAAVKSR